MTAEAGAQVLIGSRGIESGEGEVGGAEVSEAKRQYFSIFLFHLLHLPVVVACKVNAFLFGDFLVLFRFFDCGCHRSVRSGDGESRVVDFVRNNLRFDEKISLNYFPSA